MQQMAALAAQAGIPLFVDAAAERPDTPNYYLQAGASVVAYSGGVPAFHQILEPIVLRRF